MVTKPRDLNSKNYFYQAIGLLKDQTASEET